jgi:hypothetical protein
MGWLWIHTCIRRCSRGQQKLTLINERSFSCCIDVLTVLDPFVVCFVCTGRRGIVLLKGYLQRLQYHPNLVDLNQITLMKASSSTLGSFSYGLAAISHYLLVCSIAEDGGEC